LIIRIGGNLVGKTFIVHQEETRMNHPTRNKGAGRLGGSWGLFVGILGTARNCGTSWEEVSTSTGHHARKIGRMRGPLPGSRGRKVVRQF